MLDAHDMIPKVILYYIVHTYLYPSIDQPNLMEASAPLEKKTIDSTYVLLRVVI